MASSPSPATTSAEASSAAVSPPSYTSTPVQPGAKPEPRADEKIAYEKPIPEEGIEPVKKFNDADLPEVVPEGYIPSEKKDKSQDGSGYQDKAAMRSADEAQNVPLEYSRTPPPAFHQHTNSYNSANRLSVPLDMMNPSMSNVPAEEPHTVTPLHLLSDQNDMVDCPFCLRRCETRVERNASWLTHIVATCLFLTTFCGVLAPYMRHWATHVSHWCQNCNRKVACRQYGSREMKPLGTPEHLRAVSKFPAASPQQPAAAVGQEQV